MSLGQYISKDFLLRRNYKGNRISVLTRRSGESENLSIIPQITAVGLTTVCRRMGICAFKCLQYLLDVLYRHGKWFPENLDCRRVAVVFPKHQLAVIVMQMNYHLVSIVIVQKKKKRKNNRKQVLRKGMQRLLLSGGMVSAVQFHMTQTPCRVECREKRIIGVLQCASAYSIRKKKKFV